MSRGGTASFVGFNRDGRAFMRVIALALATASAAAVAGCSEAARQRYPDASLFLDSGASDQGGGADGVSRDAGGIDVTVEGRIVEPTDLANLRVLLREGRLLGWIHAAVHPRGLYVFTYRKPGDFFSFADFPVVAATDTVAMKLTNVKRHDAVVLTGDFVDNPKTPLPHIALTDLQMVKSYASDENPPPRTPEVAIPDDLMGATELIGKVHAVANDGRILVVEYRDAVIPVYVRVPALTSGLYRNDKVRIKFEFALLPPRPTHLWLDTAAANPLEVMEALVEQHGMPYETEGTLVRFPLSPQISVDVYALQVTDSDGVTREYTLLNDRDPVLFTRIREKLAQAWTSRPGEGIDGRNKLINPKIQVRAKGTFNVIDRNQANAQILLASPDDLSFTFLP